MYDCEILSELYRYNPPSYVKADNGSDSEALESDVDFEEDIRDPNKPNDIFLVMGLSKGTIISVWVDHLQHIYARFSLHRQKVH